MSKDSEITAEASQNQHAAKAIAPAWHTAGVLLLVSGLTALSALMGGAIPSGHVHHRVVGYTITLVAEWLIVAFIWFGIRLRGVSLRTLAGGMLPNWRAVLRDLGLAVAFLIAANIILTILGRLLHAAPNQTLRNLLPQGSVEDAVFLLLALTAGICEEMIFRGYLQQQFAAWTTRAAAGIIVQGLAFGAAHSYQGLKFVLIISVYGCLFGWLARWRRSLRPGMIAHFLQDGVGGLLLARFALK